MLVVRAVPRGAQARRPTFADVESRDVPVGAAFAGSGLSGVEGVADVAFRGCSAEDTGVEGG
jgi:hypothetical protein